MKFGFIGTGNMGGAIIGGMVKAFAPENITVADANKSLALEFADKYGVKAVDSNIKACDVDFLFLCVKPNIIFNVIEEIKESIGFDTTIVSIAAGKSLEGLEAAFGKEAKIIRVMPNTPALVGEGMSAVCANKNVEKEELEVVLDIFSRLGRAEEVSENLMDAVTGISGSSPAYVFMMLEAMADAGVKAGIPRQKAYTFAAQAVLGSAKMLLDTGKHPGELKDMVCSPGGTTIEAVASLEKSGFRSALIEAIDEAIEKSKNM